MRTTKAAALWVTLALVVVACGGEEGEDAGGAPPTSRAVPPPTKTAGDDDDIDSEATLRVAWCCPPNAFDPAFAVSGVVDFDYLQPIYDGLALRTPTGPEPGLATSWEESDDGLTWTLELREGVEFHDGTPFDAEAVVANLERMKSIDGSTQAGALASVESVVAVGSHQVELHLSDPNRILPYVLASPAGMMASPAAFDDLAQSPVGAGPYRLAAVGQNLVTYERFEGYWDPSAAKTAKIELQAITDQNARFNAFQSGQVDMTVVLADYATAADIADDTGGTLYTTENTVAITSWTLHLNTSTEALADPSVRRALSLAIDRTAIGEDLLGGSCTPTATPFQPTSRWYPADVADEAAAHDPAQAQQLLADAGWADLTLRIGLGDTNPIPDIAQAVQAQLDEIGVTSELITAPSSEARQNYLDGQYDALILSTFPTIMDPAAYMREYVTGGMNLGEVPAGLAPLIEDANALGLDDSARDDAYREIAVQLALDPLGISICSANSGWLVTSHVVGADQMGESGGFRYRPVGVLRD